MLEVGSIFFYKNGDDKERPYVCISVYTNKAGVPYNWLVLPITSSTKVGKDNLVKIEHPELSKSFAKINNMTTMQNLDVRKIKILNHHVDSYTIRSIIIKITKQFKSNEK